MGEKIPINLRDADCCANCKHAYGEDFEDGGYWFVCGLYDTDNIDKTTICDSHEK